MPLVLTDRPGLQCQGAPEDYGWAKSLMELIRCCHEADTPRKRLELPQSKPSRQHQPGSLNSPHTFPASSLMSPDLVCPIRQELVR